MINWTLEDPLIQKEAAKMGLDWYFLKAIRQAENGAPGREFGVLSVPAPTYAEQLEICARTVAHRLAAFPGNPLQKNAFNRIVYTPSWIAYFAHIWAPEGVDNDPHHLNSFWCSNVIDFYKKFVGGTFEDGSHFNTPST